MALEREQWEELLRVNKARAAWFKTLTPEQQVEVYKAKLEWQAKERIQQEQTRGVIMDSALKHVYQPIKPFEIKPLDNPYGDAIRNSGYRQPAIPQPRCVQQIVDGVLGLRCF